MTIETRLAEIGQLAWRHFPLPFEGTKRAKFHIEQLEKVVREYAYRQEALQELEVRLMPLCARCSEYGECRPRGSTGCEGLGRYE